jgi:hypothetical protein
MGHGELRTGLGLAEAGFSCAGAASHAQTDELAGMRA